MASMTVIVTNEGTPEEPRWVARASDGAAPMGAWNLTDPLRAAVHKAVADQHGAHYGEISISYSGVEPT